MSKPIEPSYDTYHDPAYYKLLFAVEDQHFWFQSRNRIIASLVRQIIAGWQPGYRVMEMGCGTGVVLQKLEEICRPNVVMGMDLFEEGLQLARHRTHCPLVQGDIHQVSFTEPFNLIGTFDVLEHISDDDRALSDIHRLLTPDGVLLLTVPAHTTLWSYFDEASHHYRRYSMAQLSDKLTSAGYQVEYMTQFMVLLFPLIWLGRRLAAWRDRKRSNDAAKPCDLAADELHIVPVINGILKWLLTQEAWLIKRRWHLPIGSSIIAIARKTTIPANA